eukprot:1195662-Prorocentrum_minimum.AAC.4
MGIISPGLRADGHHQPADACYAGGGRDYRRGVRQVPLGTNEKVEHRQPSEQPMNRQIRVSLITLKQIHK